MSQRDSLYRKVLRFASTFFSFLFFLFFRRLHPLFGKVFRRLRLLFVVPAGRTDDSFPRPAFFRGISILHIFSLISICALTILDKYYILIISKYRTLKRENDERQRMSILHALSFLFILCAGRARRNVSDRYHQKFSARKGDIILQQNRQSGISSASSAGPGLFLRFTLTFEEAREAFLLIIDRRSPVSRRIMSFVLLAAALVCVCLYGLHPYGLQFALTALFFALFSYLVSAAPALRVGRAARAVAKRAGVYELTLCEEGYLILPGGETLLLDGDARSRAYETDRLFAIRPDRFHTVCLPKRSIPESEHSLVRTILKTNIRAFHDRRGVTYR